MARMLLLTVVVCMCVAASGSALGAQDSTTGPGDEQAQIKKGGQVVGQVCATCHAATLVRMLQVHRQTREQWKDTVHFMISRGAQVMPDEIEPVIAFLATTAGPVAAGPRPSTALGAGPSTPLGASPQGRGGRGGRGGDAGPPAPAEVVVTSAIPGVITAGTKIQLVKFPVQGTEGPVGAPGGDGILFTERNLDRITKVDSQGNLTSFVEHSNGSNGLGFDPKGRLISVQRARNNEKVGVLYPPGSEATLADNYQGTKFNALNDLLIDRRGGIYFSDTEGIYYLSPSGALGKVIADVENPNGIELSPDEKTAYVNDKDGLYLLAYDVKADGTLTNRRNFGKYKSLTISGHADPRLAEDNGADGIAVDNDGRVYVATNVGVEVFSPKGDYLGAIPIGIWGGEQNMLRKPQNLAFSGPDKKTLYTVGSNAIYKVQLQAAGIKGRSK